MNIRWLIMGLFLLTLCTTPVSATVEKDAAAEEDIPEVVVESQRLVEKQDKITIKPEGLPANVNIVTKEDLEKTPVTNYLDIFRKIPGVYVSKYSSAFMGDRISMRGFTGNHSREVAVFVDGMPMNMLDLVPGYADLEWLVPEMVERIEVIKGPFSALYGDFTLGGVINIITKKVDQPSVGFYGGTYGTVQGVGVLSDPSWSSSLKNITPFLVWEGYSRDGYRDNSNYDRGQFFNKFTFPLWQGDLSARIHYVARSCGNPGFLNINSMKSGLSRTSAVDNNERGDAEMANLVVNYEPRGGEEGFHGTLYYCYHQNNISGTYPPQPQYRAFTFENYFGWKLLYDYRPFECLSLEVGNDLRYDAVSQNRWNTLNYYTLIKHTQDYAFDVFSTGFFTQAQYKPFSFIKFMGGGRFDQYAINLVNELYPQNSGKASPNLWSPKIGVVITPYKDINIFVNKGRGFRSPAAFELSPSSAIQKKNFNLGLSKLESWDVGINGLLFNRVYVSFDYFNTLYHGEGALNPATQMYENLGTSKRTGLEVEARIFLTRDLTLYGSWMDARARLKNPSTPGAVYIPRTPEDQGIVGLEFHKPWRDQRFGLDFYYLRVSRIPIDATGTLIASQFDQYHWKLTYGYKKWTATLDATFSPRRYASDAYTGDLVTGIAMVPLPQWEVLGGLKYQF